MWMITAVTDGLPRYWGGVFGPGTRVDSGAWPRGRFFGGDSGPEDVDPNMSGVAGTTLERPQ